MGPTFIKARAMAATLDGSWQVDHFLRINMTHVVSFRVIEATPESMVMEVFFVNRSIATIISVDVDDIKGFVRS